MHRLATLLLLSLASCSTGEESSRLDELEDRVTALNARVEQLETENATQATALASAEAALSWATSMATAVALDENGDVVFTGVNVYVQNGLGSTADTAPNGKGNLVVGYDEDRTEGTCIGGDFDGDPCNGDLACPGGACNVQVVSEKTGSHNLLVGPGHSYTSSGSLLVGEENTASGDFAICGGWRNTVNARSAAIVGGTQNVVDGDRGVIVGGGGNSIAVTAASAVVLGGADLEATTDNAIVPMP